MNTVIKIAVHVLCVLIICNLVGGESVLHKESIEMPLWRKKQSSSKEAKPTAYQQLHEAETVTDEDHDLDQPPLKTTTWQKFVAWLKTKTK